MNKFVKATSHVVLFCVLHCEIAEIRCCIINGGTDMREQRAELEGPGVSTVSTVSTQRCVKTNDVM